MLASHTADIDVDKEMVAAFCEFDTACVGRLERETFKKILCGDNIEVILSSYTACSMHTNVPPTYAFVNSAAGC